MTEKQLAELVTLGLLIPTRAIKDKRGRIIKREYRLSHVARLLLK